MTNEYIADMTLQWRHNEYDGVSNHQPHDCLHNGLLRRTTKKAPKLRITGLCEGNSPVAGEFPAQWASNAECVSIWWRHHVGQITSSDRWWSKTTYDIHNSIAYQHIWLLEYVPHCCCVPHNWLLHMYITRKLINTIGCYITMIGSEKVRTTFMWNRSTKYLNQHKVTTHMKYSTYHFVELNTMRAFWHPNRFS